MTEVKLEKVTSDNFMAIFRLKVHPDQEGLVANNIESLAEAYVAYEFARPFALYAQGEGKDEDKPVGFVMLSVEELSQGVVWVWRMMIGQEFQRQGYGLAAMQSVIEHVRSIPEASKILLSHGPKEGSAGPFYAKLGFTYTGEIDDGEQVMELGL